MSYHHPQSVEEDWVIFPGGELEGKRPRTLCAACRQQLNKAAADQRASTARPRTVCFWCYRAELDRERRLKAAGALDTASPTRFQFGLPFEPVNKPRLELLKAERAAARAAIQVGGTYETKRRQAQIAARRALDAIAAGLEARELAAVERRRLMAGAIHAVELQLPEAWLPFVVAG